MTTVQTEILKNYLYFYIVILKCNQTAIQYLVNITLSLVVTSRNDKKLSTGLRPIYVMFFKFLPISFQMKNNDDMWL